jgi:hypothetical protein
MNFSKFKMRLKEYYSKKNINKPIPDDPFLFWLIGFTEGDGSFVVNKRKDLAFVLIQGIRNKQVLNHIHNVLGLGQIIKQGPRVYRLIIRQKKEIELIILLFNGNLVLPSRKKQFNEFFKIFSQKKDVLKINYINQKNMPSLDNQWLLGFTEAEGCFTISLLSNSNAFRTRYIISQKGDLNLPVLSKCIELFNTGRIEGHSKKDNYSFIVSGLSNISKIYSYFDKNLIYFIGIKKQSYLKFKQLNQSFEKKDHLNLKKRPLLIKLASQINSISRKQK